MEAPLDLTVIVPAYDDFRLIIGCVRSWLRYGPPAAEILIACGGRPETLERLRDFSKVHPQITVLPYHGPANPQALRNTAARKSKRTALLFLNSDVVLKATSRGLFERMFSLAADSKAGAIGCINLFEDNKTIQQAGYYIRPGGLCSPVYEGCSLKRVLRHTGTRTFPYGFRKSRAVTAVSGAALLVNRRQFTRVGGFDERFVQAGADAELCLRLNAAGHATQLAGGGHIVRRLPRTHTLGPPAPDEAALLYRAALPAFDKTNGDPCSPLITNPMAGR